MPESAKGGDRADHPTDGTARVNWLEATFGLLPQRQVVQLRWGSRNGSNTAVEGIGTANIRT